MQFVSILKYCFVSGFHFSAIFVLFHKSENAGNFGFFQFTSRYGSKLSATDCYTHLLKQNLSEIQLNALILQNDPNQISRERFKFANSQTKILSLVSDSWNGKRQKPSLS